MAQTYAIKGVQGPRPWSPQQGAAAGQTFHEYRLQVEGLEKPVAVNYKPDSPAPQAGQQVLLDVQPHPRFDDLLKGKRVQEQQQGRRGSSPEERKSIQAQTALKAAVEFHSRDDKPPIDVVQTAAVFADWLETRS